MNDEKDLELALTPEMEAELSDGKGNDKESD